MPIVSVSRAVAHNVYTGSHPTTGASNSPRAVSGSGGVTTADIASPSRQGVIPTPANVVAHGSTAQVGNPAATQIADVRTPNKPAFSLPSGENFPLRSAAAEGPRPTAGQSDTNLKLATPDKPAFSLPTGENFPLRSAATEGPRPNPLPAPYAQSAAQRPSSLLDLRA